MSKSGAGRAKAQASAKESPDLRESGDIGHRRATAERIAELHFFGVLLPGRANGDELRSSVKV